ncbi:MAG: hypothetical protein KGD70_07115 [Candidatus Lokiarchaeota archaeon]|nr:hypothetical protein [Candidatus Lokiarchaeota archaeon]
MNFIQILFIGGVVGMIFLMCIIEVLLDRAGKRRHERKKRKREQPTQYCKKCEKDVIPETKKRIGINRFERQYCPHCNYQLNREYNNIYCIIFLVIMFSQLFLIL